MRPVSTFFLIFNCQTPVKITVATPEKNGEYAKRDVEVTLGKKS